MSYEYDYEEEEAENRYSNRRWKELQKGRMLCLKCNQQVREMELAIACDASHRNGCLNLLCRSCATSGDHPFRPCQCHTLVEHEKILWCPECIEDFPKCNSCHGSLCPSCQVDNTEDYGRLCQHCCWAMQDLLGRNPAGVRVCGAPWPRYVIPVDIQTAVQQLHEKVGKKKPKKKRTSKGRLKHDDDEDGKPPAKASSHYVYVLLAREGGPYRETEVTVAGVYSTKEVAVEAAIVKFEEVSHGCYRDGRWEEHRSFEQTGDYTSDGKENGTLLKQVHGEGSWEEMALQKTLLDEQLERKPKRRFMSAVKQARASRPL